MLGKTKIAMVVAEFLGVAAITSVVLAVSKSGVGFSIFVAAAAGIVVTSLGLAVGRLSGAHFNPAVTLGMWTTRKIPTLQAVVFIAAQFLGALAAQDLYEYMNGTPLPNIAGKAFDWRVLVAEAVGAFILTFVIASAVYQGYRGLRFATTIGGAVFLGVLVASVASNGAVNPAVALGLNSWGRAYAVGPLLGGVIGVNLYAFLFAPTERGVADKSAPTTTVASRAVRKAAPVLSVKKTAAPSPKKSTKATHTGRKAK